jgi:hypothetical protein
MFGELAKTILKEQALDLGIKCLELAGEALLNAAKRLSESRIASEQNRNRVSSEISVLKESIVVQ